LEVIAIERTPRPQPGAFGPHATPIWKVTHAVINPITFEVVASRVAGSDLPGIVNQKQAIMTNGFSQGEAVLAMTPTPLQTGHRLKLGFSSPPRATQRFDPVEPLLVICRLDRADDRFADRPDADKFQDVAP